MNNILLPVSEHQLFGKVAAFTDIHWGKRSNDRQSNQDNMDFVDWFIAEAQAWGADIVVFLGDWHDHRNALNISTMNFSLAAMEKLASSFPQFVMINGNHDLMYRENRVLNSVEFGRNIDNLVIIKEPTTVGNVTFMPWLVADEWKDIPQVPSKYIFGHFELPHFFMNAMVEMPDHGGLKQEHFKNQDFVFSGHFHKRQSRGKVVYIGNTFPFTFSDAWDDDRGAMFMQWNCEPFFKEWPQAPTYRTMKASEMLENPQQFMVTKSYNRVVLDIDLSYDEAQFIKSTFMHAFDARKIDLIPVNKDSVDQEFDDNVMFQSIDQIIELGLKTISSPGIDSETLVDIYKGLI